MIMMAIKFLFHLHILRRINYLVKGNPLLVPLLSHMSAVHQIMPPFSFRSVLIFTQKVIGLLCGLFLSGFPIINLYDFVTSHVCYVSCPSHPPSFDHPVILRRIGVLSQKTKNTATAQKLKWRQIVFLMRLSSNKVSFLRTTGDVVWQFKLCGLFTPNFRFRL